MRVVVLGAGVSGHTTASFLKKKLGKKHDVIVVSPSQYYQWVPSNIWVGVGKMTTDQVRFKLEKVYNRWGIELKQAKATAIYPEGDSNTKKGLVEISYTSAEK
ncbi:MAG: NAD(P)/FAD-dependent oxidoreductase, partial [Prolixibacteraceae bacterium]|nr:NAD(P)/FAD-dependent oxidoreductase [Prolixibacteraceae bacterium]